MLALASWHYCQYHVHWVSSLSSLSHHHRGRCRDHAERTTPHHLGQVCPRYGVSSLDTASVVRGLQNNHVHPKTGMSECTHHVQLPDPSRCLHMNACYYPFASYVSASFLSKKMRIDNQTRFAGCSVKLTDGIKHLVILLVGFIMDVCIVYSPKLFFVLAGPVTPRVGLTL